MGAVYATVDELSSYWRTMTSDEQTRAEVLLESVSSELRIIANSVGKDLDALIADSDDYGTLVKSVVMDTVARILNQSTTGEAMSQISESAMGYTQSGTYLVPGGGSTILNRDLKRLKLKKQQVSSVEIWNYGQTT
jgi:hypothetical protein